MRADARGARRVARYALLVAVAVVVLFPIYAAVLAAFKPGNKIFDHPESLLPVDLTFDTLQEAWDTGNLGRYLVNSLGVSIAITVGQIITSLLAAYAFAFLQFPFRNALFVVFLATLLVPLEATVVINRETIQSWGWVDTYQALIVPFLATAFGTFLIRQVFLTLPKDLREAAALDGLGHLAFLREVAVPLARPTIAAFGLFSFLAAWNQYLWPLVVTNEPNRRTVQIGLKSLAAANLDQLNLVMAGTVIAAVPIFVLLLVFQRQLIRDLTAGAVKG